MTNDEFDETPSETKKTNLMLNRKSIRNLKRLMADLEDEHNFPRDLKESYCFNAAVDLIIQSASPELIDQEAKEKGYDEQETQTLHEYYKWFNARFVELLKKDVNTRIQADKRKTRPSSNSED
ncbi:hypothetical protein [Nocardia yunnanensis]|uniref:hypothetical protein n=1 Tax=Nocardia yunnanensis TaxID=2382165 RepID=UPI0013C4956B|nr:hypothetical protein [Nocardia yunnanensis]